MTESSADLYDPLEPGRTADGLSQPVEVDYSIPGDIVMIYPETSRPRIVVRTPSQRMDWVVALDSPQAENLGSAPSTIQYRGEFYEIAGFHPHGSAWEYHLNPWPPSEPNRRTIAYSREAELTRRQDEFAFQRLQKRARRIVVLLPFIGLLPREVQLELAERLPIDVYRATFWSCIGEIVFGTYIIFMGGIVSALLSLSEQRDVSLFPNLLGIPVSVWLTISPFIIVEALLRWQRLSRYGHISGNLLLELLWKIFR